MPAKTCFQQCLAIIVFLLAIAPAVRRTVYADARANAAQVYNWLLLQQGPMGILGNQENDDFSGLYTNALAAICYIHKADTARAEQVFSFFEQHLDSVAKQPPGGFCQFWDAATGQPHLDSDRWIGDNAWLLIALNYHYCTTGDDKYAEMRRTIAGWLISLQDVDGGIWSGFNQSGPMDWKSTEGNLDCYAALIERPLKRQSVGHFLRDYMWIPSEGRFRMGSTTSDSALDGCSFGVAALGSAYSAALQYAELTFLCEHRADATGNLVTGFCDFIARDRIWLEGTGQMVVAYRTTGKHEQAQLFLEELDKAMMPSTRFPGTVGLPCHTNNPAWPTGSTTIFVPSQAWYLLGAWQFNPMQCINCNYPQAIDFNRDGKADFKDYCRLARRWLQNEPSVDVAPPPDGDGTVDSNDLALLAENWLTATTIPPLPEPASNPAPPNGATSVNPLLDLSWASGSGAASHDVYFGTSSPGTFQSNQTAATFDPGIMAADNTYYWRVDELNLWGKTTGTVWSFTTMAGPPPP